MQIAAVHDHDVDIARQLAMLKSIIQQMNALVLRISLSASSPASYRLAPT